MIQCDQLQLWIWINWIGWQERTDNGYYQDTLKGILSYNRGYINIRWQFKMGTYVHSTSIYTPFPIYPRLIQNSYRFSYRSTTIETHSYQRFSHSTQSHKYPQINPKIPFIPWYINLYRHSHFPYNQIPIQITLNPLSHLHLSHFPATQYDT
jgi:hypothetical protein